MSHAPYRIALDALAGRGFDVVLIGGGVNGASVANHLSAAGYTTLVVEKEDFGSGASSRSSRLLHCGLAGLSPPKGNPWQFLLHPGLLRQGLKSAREMSKAREEFATTMPERVNPFTFCVPIYEDGPYSGWQMDLGFRALEKVGGSKVPLDYCRLNRPETLAHPVGRYLAQPEKLRGMATFREYQFEFAERMVVDTLLAAEKNGTVSRNHTAATRFDRSGDRWDITLTDQLDTAAPPVVVHGKLLLNMTGAWIDQVNTLNPAPVNRRLIQSHKGVHLMLHLPEELKGFGVYKFTGDEHGFMYVVPWRGMHYVGPTDLPYDGSLDNIHPTERDLDVVLGTFATVFPSIRVSRQDIVYSWAGVQPKTYEPHDPNGSWSREFHRVGPASGPQLFALTGATLGRSRMSGRDGLKLVQSVIAPSGRPGKLNYSAHHRPGTDGTGVRRNSHDRIDLADIAYAVEHEQACTIEDVLFRRSGLGWDADMGCEKLEVVATDMGRLLNWPADRVETEKRRYLNLLAERHRTGPLHRNTEGM